MSTHATPIFTLTDSASRPEISALDRAGRLEMQTHQECPPRPISSLEYALTENRACKSFRIRTYNFIGLKAPWNEHLQKTGGGGCNSTPQQNNLIPAVRKTEQPPWYRHLAGPLGRRRNPGQRKKRMRGERAQHITDWSEGQLDPPAGDNGVRVRGRCARLRLRPGEVGPPMRGTSGSVQRCPANPARPGREQR